MSEEKIYWKGIHQLNDSDAGLLELENREFAEKLPSDLFGKNQDTDSDDQLSTRRDFLKYLGFSTAAAAIAACDGPVIKSVPYVVKPEQITPGNANYYATSYWDGYDFSNILVKTREGRPIKIEPNSDAPDFYQTNARVHASILSLYDTRRLQIPKANATDISWNDLYDRVRKKLDTLNQNNQGVVLLTNSLISPTTQDIIEQLIAKYPNIQHVQYEALPQDGVLDAYELKYGQRAMANYDFSLAKVIVSIDADFLGDWQNGGYDSSYVKSRIPNESDKKASMSYHIHLESNLSLTGSNADKRISLKPAEIKKVLAHVYRNICLGFDIDGENSVIQSIVDHILEKIKVNPSEAVVVSGIESRDAQSMVLAINEKIKSSSFLPDQPLYFKKGTASAIENISRRIAIGEINGLIWHGVNPVYSSPIGQQLGQQIQNLDFSWALSTVYDETAVLAKFVAPTSHYLEAWNDYHPKSGYYNIAQPTIRPLFHTKDFQQILLDLADIPISHVDYIKNYWLTNILIDSDWNQILHDGFYTKNEPFQSIDDSDELVSIDATALIDAEDHPMSLVLYPKISLGDGQQAGNPWLQEMPDPISRVSWDNYLTISISDAHSLGVVNTTNAHGAIDGSIVRIKVRDREFEVPVLVQPGQAPGTVGLALGYGRNQGVKKEMQIGINAFQLLHENKRIQSVEITPIGGKVHEFACIQLQNTVMGRGEIIKETSLEEFNTKGKEHYNPVVHVSKNHMEVSVRHQEVDAWRSFDHSIGHFFNLSIDLNACTGCGACVIACQAENNVPVVGKREVRRSRDMHWLRIDRYYSSNDTFQKDHEEAEETTWFGEAFGTFRKLEKAAENPQVVFQPVMCQHCNHAPCETVCPVAATVHGRQGQNQMAYNRCVGTRYCANNCPYKVRRFNWFRYNKNREFDYHMNSPLGRMVLNPDVVVRSRGVMEKCSFCMQRTQKTIMDAKLEGRQIEDGEFNTACAQACTTGALVFGDVNDKNSKVAKLKKSKRKYYMIESIGTKPNVMYQLKVRNTGKTKGHPITKEV